ncbi:MAG: RCC1-like domain-containing protein, partial [Dehalococcoidia bacterium]
MVLNLSCTIATGGRHTVGIRPDGTVVATGNNDDGQCNVGG